MVDLDAYFARIGYDGPRAATPQVLARLHALHPAAVTFEAIDCLLDRGVDISPAAVDAKIIAGGRGGYCFEQNSLFRRVLEALGFRVTGLAARVRWNMPPDAPAQPRTHQVLSVEIPGEPGRRLVDVGFGGCVLTTPLPLAPHVETETPHDVYRLTPVGDELRLEVRREAGWVAAYDVSLTPCEPRDYEMANWFTSTHPTSHFRHTLLAGRTTPEARYGLLFNRLAIRPVGGEPTYAFLDADGIEHHLRETFGLPVEPSWRPAIETAARGAP
ncbi:MAG: arylamine N-acetyltransferase [Phenylobacterium sp.]|uniref:arylamine N-acetyltransferase family protein n=1 Tax=Phenylobacterium sp. TaxID=1871053 RepID=UPI001A644893|nr:arylamine N-acetyltransferase [Phenylobacterium sp.]MBL8769869.1 arylamine N-acetyltransferase [Phenylobacterium sp.]